MSFPLEKYRYYVNGNKVVAVSTYCKKSVRGVAVCHPDDEFDLEKGKRIAAAKCNERIAKKRLERASSKAIQAGFDVEEAKKYHERMIEYYNDAFAAYNEAAIEYDKLVESLKN